MIAPCCPFLGNIEIGQEIEPLTRGPLLPPHLMRWSASIENWHRIHYDRPYAVTHDGLPDLLVNGSWKQHFVMQLLRRWAGTSGWVWTVDFQFRGMNLVGETLTAWARVRDLRTLGQLGVVETVAGTLNQTGKGTASWRRPDNVCCKGVPIAIRNETTNGKRSRRYGHVKIERASYGITSARPTSRANDGISEGAREPVAESGAS